MTGRQRIRKGGGFAAFIGKWASIGALLAVFAFFAIKMPSMFLTSSNMTTILRSISITTIVAIGLTITLVVGGFDLSSGAMASYSGAFVISFFVWYKMSMWLAIPLTIAITVATMMATMALIVVFKIPDLLATLAMMFFLDGILLTYSGGGAISEGMPRADGRETFGKIPQAFKDMGQAPTTIMMMMIVGAWPCPRNACGILPKVSRPSARGIPSLMAPPPEYISEMPSRKNIMARVARRSGILNTTMSAIVAIMVAITVATMMATMALIVVFKIPDLLATLAMMFFLDGISLTYSGGGAISEGMPRADGRETFGKIPQAFKDMGQAPTIIIIMIVVVIVVHVFLNYTKYGRYMYAVGGNKEAARLSGIPVYRFRVYAGILAAVFIGLGGILVASRNMSAQIQGAAGYAMPAVSAVFIGRSVAGAGKPNAFGTFVGASLVGVLENGLIMMSVPYYSLNAVKGVVLAIALASTYYTSSEDA